MSVVHTVAQATLAPSPTTSPVVEAVKVAVVHHAATAQTSPFQGLSDLLNKWAALLSPYIVVIGAAIASAVQVPLNKLLPWLSHETAQVQDLRRRLLAVALPLLGTYLSGLATGQNTLHLAPWVFLVSQILYSAVQALKASGGTQFANQELATDEVAG